MKYVKNIFELLKIITTIFIIIIALENISYPSDNFDKILPGSIISKIDARDAVNCRPTIIENRVFWTTRESNNTILYAGNLEKGEIVWSKKLLPFTDVFPLIANSKMVFLPVNTNNRGILYATDAHSGNILWEYKGDLIKYTYYPPFIHPQQELIRIPPLLFEDIIFLSLGASRIVALDTKTGKILWELNFWAGYTKVKMYLEKGLLYVKVAEVFFKVLNPKTGKEVHNPIPKHYVNKILKIDNDFLIGGNTVFIREEDATETGDEIICYDFSNKKELWRKSKYSFFPEYYLNNTLYTVDTRNIGVLGIKQTKYLTAIEASTGNEKWKVDISGCVFMSYSVLSSKDKLFIKCDNGNLLIIDSKTGNIFWNLYDKAKKSEIKNTYSYIKTDRAIFVINDMIYYVLL